VGPIVSVDNEKNIFSLPGIETSAVQSAAIPTELSQLLF
jgi:hypothetical protein